MIIYKITNSINNKCYIGLTTLPFSLRWSTHKNDIIKSDYPLYRSIRKYGLEAFKIETICSALNTKSLSELEIYFIKYYNSVVPNGYNCTYGGERPIYSEESRKKMSLAKKGKSPWNKGLKTGLQLIEHKIKAAAGNFKPIQSISPEGVVKNYKSLKETKKDGFNPSQVCLCCKNLAKTHRKYKFKYQSPENEGIEHGN